MDNDTLCAVFVILIVFYIYKKVRKEGMTLYPRPALSNEYSLPDNISEKYILKDYPRYAPPSSGKLTKFLYNPTVDDPPTEYVYDTPFKVGQGAGRDSIFGFDKSHYMTDVSQLNQLDGHTGRLDSIQQKNNVRKNKKEGMKGYQDINWQIHAPLIEPITEDDIKKFMDGLVISKSHVQYLPAQMNPYYKPLKYMPLGQGWLQ